MSFFAGLPPDQSKISTDSNLVRYREVSLHGSHASAPDENREPLNTLTGGLLRIDDLVSHSSPIIDSMYENNKVCKFLKEIFNS